MNERRAGPLNDPTDQELVSRVVAGEAAAVEELFRRHHRAAFGWNRLVHDAPG